jgi:hypothetical protein
MPVLTSFAPNIYLNVIVLLSLTSNLSLLLSFWAFSIVRISTNRKHNVSETGSVSVFRGGGGSTYNTEKPKACLSTGVERPWKPRGF